MEMNLKPQDVVIALKLASGGVLENYAALGKALGMSASEVHAGVRRLAEARLIDPSTRQVRITPLRNFLVHGVPYAFPVRPKELTRGIPTAWGSPFLAEKFASDNQPVPVWPHPEGSVKGQAVEPLYPSVPAAAEQDSNLYELLALADALRIGRARERKLAEEQLEIRLTDHVA